VSVGSIRVRTVKPSPVVTLLVGTSAPGLVLVWFPFEVADCPKGLRGVEELWLAVDIDPGMRRGPELRGFEVGIVPGCP
jgi:hypothetical protein